MGDRKRVLAEAEAEASHQMREAALWGRKEKGGSGGPCGGLAGAHLAQAGLMVRSAERLGGEFWASLVGDGAAEAEGVTA